MVTSRWTRARLICSLAAGLLFAAASTIATASTVRAGVAVRGNRLVRDGRLWTPHGVVQIAFVAPPAAQAGVFAEAYRHYSPSDYAEMRRRGIDAVRIQASQPGLDPRGSLFDPDFRRKLIGAVHAARAAGLVVVMSVQDEKQSGEREVARLPNDATRRVWRSLAPEFAGDEGVMYELLNEPNLPPNPRNWREWTDAMNQTITVVRDAGARNVVVADGLLYAERLGGAPGLADPIGQIVYASHPYAHDDDGQRPEIWERKFGRFARRHPVIVTEWTTVPRYFCNAGTPAYAAAFLEYIEHRGIGLMVYAWDFSGPKFGSAFHGFPPRPTSYADARCDEAGFGPGALIERLYRGGPVEAGR